MASPLILGPTLTPIIENEFKRYLRPEAKSSDFMELNGL
jgi:hypothetical protein